MSKDLIIVVDMQNVYLGGQEWECIHMDDTTSNIVRLAKESNADVILTLFKEPNEPKGTWVEYNKEYEDINRDSYKNELIPEIKALVGGANILGIIEKSTYSSITDDLKQFVSKYDRVLITGVVAECCCIFTAHSVIDLGCECLWVKDAISGQSVENEQMCEKLLSCQFPLHGRVITTSDYLG